MPLNTMKPGSLGARRKLASRAIYNGQVHGNTVVRPKECTHSLRNPVASYVKSSGCQASAGFYEKMRKMNRPPRPQQ